MASRALRIWTDQVVGACGHPCSAWPLVKRGGILYVMCDVCQGSAPEPILVRIKGDWKPVEEEIVSPAKTPAKRTTRKKKTVVNAWLNL